MFEFGCDRHTSEPGTTEYKESSSKFYLKFSYSCSEVPIAKGTEFQVATPFESVRNLNTITAE